MTIRHPLAYSLTVLCSLLFLAATAPAIRAPTLPLADRVRAAETVFVGVVTNRVTEGDWVRADLLVEEPLLRASKGQTVPVTWRLFIVGGRLVPDPEGGNGQVVRMKRVGGQPVFDIPEGARRIAILKDKHKGRYWLRGDKFENLGQLEEVRKIITSIKEEGK